MAPRMMLNSLFGTDSYQASGLVVDVQAKTSIGPVRNSVTAQPGSAVRLRLETDIGPIIVREGDPS